jgi:fructokinase
MNDDELSVLTRMFSLRGDVRQRIERLVCMFGFQVVAVTCGAAGSLLYQEDNWSEQTRAQQAEIVDTVGAGDAFTAALTVGLLVGMRLDEVHSIAAEVARYVCSRRGAMPRMPAKFRSKFRERLSPSGTSGQNCCSY